MLFFISRIFFYMSLISLSGVLILDISPMILYIQFLEYHPLGVFHFKNRKIEERLLKMEDAFGKAESVRHKVMLPRALVMVSRLI